MRWIVLLLALAAASLSTTCAGDRSPSQPILASRSVSATGEGQTAGEIGFIAKSAGVTEITATPSRFRLQCDESGEAQWIILGIGGLKPASETLRYTFAAADTVHALSGSVFAGVADWERETWRWQDVSMIGWRGGYPDQYYVGFEIPPEAEAVSPDGDLYFAVVASGSWAEASAARSCYVEWEYDAPFLAAPALAWDGPGVGSIALDPGPDWQSPQCAGLALYQCEGAWDPASAVELDHWDQDYLPATYGVGHGPRSYAAALLNDGWDQPPVSPYSNVLVDKEQ